ncbi:MAG: MOSC domain-containing protein [Actinobacteria bacterium]|nr:MOSC domain-containing protein [Actinomycetota bacterium]
MGRVEAIFICPHGSQPMERVEEVRAVTGGLEGDRYLLRTGYWTAVDECEVTLIEAEALETIAGPSVMNGEHRRNLVTRGVTLRDLAGSRFSVGEAILAYDRPRPPCRYVESITEPGMTRALAARRGGICARVIEPGRIRVGDPITVIDRG